MGTSEKAVRSEEEGLSVKEYLLYSLAFLVLPGACVIISSVLYYVWRDSKPRRATQINILGFIIFGFDVVIYLLYTLVIARK